VILHSVRLALECVTTFLAVAGMGYFLAAWWAVRAFAREQQAELPHFAPGVSVLKSLKGLDPGMMEAFRSHCRQHYAGDFQLLFGVASMDDPAVEAVSQLQREFPAIDIQLHLCPERLGTNGKISTLVQLAPHAKHDFLLINDSDITVTPRYFQRILACFADADQGRQTGLVTALYRGRAHGTLGSRLEALGIATDFQAGVLLSRKLEGGLSYGLGSTLAVRRAALEAMGGLSELVDQLADDYELGARVFKAGYAVQLSPEVVETGVPAYAWQGFVDHQLRWSRTVRDARPGGYFGLIFTHGLAWAMVSAFICGFSFRSLMVLALSLTLRILMAWTVGVKVLQDDQLPGALWLLPLRDLVQLGIWAAGFAGDTIVWRGERFHLRKGRLYKKPE
jgi:ceramide glucosyltransferase